MNATVIVAAIGLLATVAAAVLTSYLQRQSQRESRVFQARLAAYGEVVSGLYDYERATYNRVKARLEGRPDVEREPLRQEAWVGNAKSKADIGLAALLSARAEVHRDFEAIRASVGNLNSVSTLDQLKEFHDSIYVRLAATIERAKADIAR